MQEQNNSGEQDNVIAVSAEKLDGEELDLTSRTYKAIVEHGMEGILQSQLWKELNLTSRDGSRLAIRLEKRGMIRRERVLENGRWTYRLYPIRMPIKTTSIRDSPCLTCKVIEQCSNEGKVTPKICGMLEEWVRNEYENSKVVMKVETKPG
jgi:DNA-binding Lrp family transcriptional regulator